MAEPNPSSASAATKDKIAQLVKARRLALEKKEHWAQIFHGVTPLIGTDAALEVRRWGAGFLVETLGTPVLGTGDKTNIALEVLPLLKGYLDTGSQDEWLLKSTIQAAASAYPLVFRYIIHNPNESGIWQQMAAIKSNILRRMDTSLPGVHVCCIKFVQRIVQTQTPGLIDPRKNEADDISLALVPRDHPIIPPPNLEAEASGLLDRLLGLLQENDDDPLLITATLNSLGSLIRTRASVSNKILNTVLSFNPYRLASSPLTPKVRIMVRSLERTTKQLLTFVIKRLQNHPLAGRIDQYLQRLEQLKVKVFEEGSRKRAAPVEPTDGLDSAKRQRLGADVRGAPLWPPPLPPLPITLSQLYTLTEDAASRNFDVKALPADLVMRLLVPLLQQTDANKIDLAVNAVRARWLQVTDPTAQTALNTRQPRLPADEDDDDDYEPDYAPTEDAEQINNRLDQDASAVDAIPEEVTLGPFRLPTPPPLSDHDTLAWSEGTVQRIFGNMLSLDQPSKALQQTSGFNRLAARNHGREAWITLISRLATRAPAGLDDVAADGIKKEEGMGTALVSKQKLNFRVADRIREAILLHVIQDFRKRIDVAVAWLNEEWYNDQLQLQDYQQRTRDRDDHFAAREDHRNLSEPQPNYEKWLLKMLDGFLDYLDAKDKVLIRFLSEVPELPPAAMDKIKKLARDPERVALATGALHYLILLKPPAREASIDALEFMWRNYNEARGAAAKLLTKWRPHVLQEEPNGVVKLEVKPALAAAS